MTDNNKIKKNPDSFVFGVLEAILINPVNVSCLVKIGFVIAGNKSTSK